ncbi:MAG: hypothetical protein J7497_15310, partial [Chitinophagaceae bacterium]|nr:hypothetical protein [Chitinophagaceae bacterium]
MKIIISIIFLFGSFSGSAQTWSEWFKQKKTQIKYLTQQIAALQIYIGYARKGYEIADKGLTAIGDIKNGEFNLYRDFFSSLREVNSNLHAYSRREGIILSQNGLIKLYQRTIAEMISSGQFTNIEIDQTRTRFLMIIE